jgi:type II secretory pathway predicted ATPase ExeA
MDAQSDIKDAARAPIFSADRRLQAGTRKFTMYEASFGLKRRPFAATPDATCFLSSGPIQAALDELVVCVEQGQGIAVVTAPAGTGKTLLCERLRCELDGRFETVFLRHASFMTRRALLQTVLCELNYSYHHPSEQELRLELFPAILALQPNREALVLICDEAHQLTDSLLEELRILGDFAESGRPLVRLVLVGQLALEEKLAQPSLEAFNQRIRAHINLSTFDMAESLDYIDYRITWAGGRTDEIFTPEAINAIARASDGVPRCINQLADHTLLLAFVAEQRPAGEELVREALNDLRQLPLQWNEPVSSDRLESRGDDDARNPPVWPGRDASGFLEESAPHSITSSSYEPDVDAAGTTHGSQRFASVEVGADAEPPGLPPRATFETVSSSVGHQVESVEVGSDDWRRTLDLFNPRPTESSLVATMTDLLPQENRSAGEGRFQTDPEQRSQLHELLEDAYAAAAQAEAMKRAAAEGQERATSQTLNTVERLSISSTSRHGQDDVAITQHAVSLSQPATGFSEEVIVDRYVSIDAGFEPAVESPSDTAPTSQVRTAPGQIATPEDLRSIDRPLESSNAGDWLAVTDVAVDLTGNDSFKDEEFSSVHQARQRQPSLDNDRDDDELPVDETDVGLETESGQLDSLLPTLHRETRVDMTCTELASHHAQYWPAAASDESDLAFARGDSQTSGRIEQLADDMFAFGQSLRPAGALSTTSASILEALRHEVDELVAAETPDSPLHPASATSDSSWESVETEPVASTAAPRPFRYLFSMLRRKQQGLS